MELVSSNVAASKFMLIWDRFFTIQLYLSSHYPRERPRTPCFADRMAALSHRQQQIAQVVQAGQDRAGRQDQFLGRRQEVGNHHGRHACRHTGTDAGMAVLHRDAIGRIDAQPLGGQQIRLRVRFGPVDVIAGDDSLA